ncbi:hypothetical protein PCASD_01203 [Puccinia coronata f. sp. avenae]|uniref:Cytochrome P450 n=1 Tax=Puccinia coronata f. sp. avenae TaxID=200324 RepID=A0A2N5VLM8_9BASI|nr:hypothetical protein PCASD_01203 [Puccinia coronata f. sp. avenae]
MTHLLDFNAIISQLDLRIINSYAILILGGIAVFSFILSPNLARLMLYTFSHSVLNVVQKFLQQKGFLLDSPTASSSKSYFNNDPTVSSKFRILIRHLPCELQDVSLENIQNSLRLIYEKFTSKVPLRRFFVKAKNPVVDNSQQQPVSCFVDSEIIRNRNATACSTDSWKHSPRIWTWPWLGSLCSYTRDPLGFIQKHHQSKGNVFTTTILGYNCTFIQSNEYIQSFATATRNVLDMTGAYKLIAAPLIGEEAFFGQTKYMHQVVLSKPRIENLRERLWGLTDQLLEIKWNQCLADDQSVEVTNWRKIDLGQTLDYVIFGLDVFFLIGEQMVNKNLDQISHLFRVMDSDLSLLGILLPMINGGRCPRKEAKNKLLRILKQDVQRRIDRYVRHAIHEAFGSGDCDCAGSWCDSLDGESQRELPELLLRSELRELDGSILLDYDRGDDAAIKIINEKVEFVSIFIYGFVWAAQTNAAAATIGLVHDILLHDQSQALSGASEHSPPIPHADQIRKECASALLKENSSSAPLFEDMPHLARCLNETLRLRGTGAMVRLAEKPFHLPPQANQTQRIICPPGFIVLSPMSISLNPETYPNPIRWDPDRYQRAPFISSLSGSKKDPARCIPIDKKYLIPPATPSNPYFASWSLGQGHCPGKHLACKMISMTVARFFDKFEVRPMNEKFEKASFEDVVAAGVQRLKSSFPVLIRKRT